MAEPLVPLSLSSSVFWCVMRYLLSQNQATQPFHEGMSQTRRLAVGLPRAIKASSTVSCEFSLLHINRGHLNGTPVYRLMPGSAAEALVGIGMYRCVLGCIEKG